VQLAPDTITTSFGDEARQERNRQPTLRRDGIGGDDDVIE
jgi:hypothetical protein